VGEKPISMGKAAKGSRQMMQIAETRQTITSRSIK